MGEILVSEVGREEVAAVTQVALRLRLMRMVKLAENTGVPNGNLFFLVSDFQLELATSGGSHIWLMRMAGEPF